MADSNKNSKPPPPPWAKHQKFRSNTATAAAPPKPATASNRASRYQVGSKPPSKNRPPPKPADATYSSPIKPLAFRGSMKATPLTLARTSPAPTSAATYDEATGSSLLLNDDDNDDPLATKTKSPPPNPIDVHKRSSLQHTVLSQALRNRPKPKATTQRSKSPAPPSKSKSVPAAEEPNTSVVSRWKHHPHSKMYTSSSHSGGDDDGKSVSPQSRSVPYGAPPPVPKHVQEEHKQPPPPPQVPRGKISKYQLFDAATRERMDSAAKYSHNIAGFEDGTLKEIDKTNIEALLACMHEGSECLKNFHTALATFSNQQQTQCANFLKLFRKSKSRYAQMDTMPNFFYAISLIHTLLEETVKQSAEFAKFIQIGCLPMIEELETQCDEKYKEVYSMTKKQEKRLADCRAQAEKMRKASKSAAEKVVIARQRSEVQKSNQQLKSKQSGAGIGMIKKMGHGHSSAESTINDAYEAAREQEKKFKLAVSEYNKARTEYMQELNLGKHEIINMEHFRVDSILSVFQKIVYHQQDGHAAVDNNDDTENGKKNAKSKVYQLQADIMKHTERMTAKDVISKFIHNNIETYGEWKIPEPLEATMDMEYRDMFHSIEDAMSITLEINPHVKIPLIVPLLCERIKDLNGFQTEGIFRKSPSKAEMQRMKARLQSKNFMLDSNEVHVYSGLLKEWLRGLDDLIIPKRYYDYCVSMAKENKLKAQQFEVFYSQLPSVNRETLKYLVNFLKDLLDPQCQKHTKMDLENLAIVFGPTLLMPANELEPLVALQNAKAEKQFVISLIQNAM